MGERVREIEPIALNIIFVGDRLRHATDESVAVMAESLAAVGQINPITVRLVDNLVIDGKETDGVPVLVAGATRLAAAKRLGWKTIDTIVAEIDDVVARCREIAENLHRAELTAQEKADHIAEWVRLVEKRKVSANLAESQKKGRPGCIDEARKELGLSEGDARRAMKVASISEAAKEAAVAAHLDNNQSALLKVAAVAPSEQVEKVHQLAAARDARKQTRQPQKPAADPLSDVDANEKQVARLMSAWNAASPEARQEFLLRIDTPVMDQCPSSRGEALAS